MQLDRTHIAIRERQFLDILDLALQVTSRHARSLLGALLVLAVPLTCLNLYFLDFLRLDPEDTTAVIEFAWGMALLVFLEAPLGTMLVTLYIGIAMFSSQAIWSEIRAAGRKTLASACYYQFLWRGLLPLWGLGLALRLHADFRVSMLVGLAACWALVTGAIRGLRPFLMEIILLEQAPWRSSGSSAVTIRRRNRMLHANGASEYLGRMLIASVLAIALTFATFRSLEFVSHLLFPGAELQHATWWLLYPLVLWLVAGFLAVVRFLSYIDLRIRREGWEVELLVRAAANQEST